MAAHIHGWAEDITSWAPHIRDETSWSLLLQPHHPPYLFLLTNCPPSVHLRVPQTDNIFHNSKSFSADLSACSAFFPQIPSSNSFKSMLGHSSLRSFSILTPTPTPPLLSLCDPCPMFVRYLLRMWHHIIFGFPWHFSYYRVGSWGQDYGLTHFCAPCAQHRSWHIEEVLRMLVIELIWYYFGEWVSYGKRKGDLS